MYPVGAEIQTIGKVSIASRFSSSIYKKGSTHMFTKLTQEEAVAKCKLVHGDKYDYSKMIYLGMSEKSEFICKLHGSFWQRVYSHIQGGGCPQCGYINMGLSQKKPLQEIVDRANQKHKFKYDYSLLFALKDYRGVDFKYPIICKEHGIFIQKIDNHLSGKGCPKCADNKNGNPLRGNILEIIKEANQKHNFFTNIII